MLKQWVYQIKWSTIITVLLHVTSYNLVFALGHTFITNFISYNCLQPCKVLLCQRFKEIVISIMEFPQIFFDHASMLSKTPLPLDPKGALLSWGCAGHWSKLKSVQYSWNNFERSVLWQSALSCQNNSFVKAQTGYVGTQLGPVSSNLQHAISYFQYHFLSLILTRPTH